MLRDHELQERINYGTMTDVEDNQQNHFIEGKDEPGKKTPQFLAGFAGNISAIIAGCVIGWTSPSIPHLQDPDTPIIISKNEESWISSLAPLAAACGPFLAGFMAEKLGRRNTLLLAAIPSIISWICLAAGRTVPLLYFGRILAGLYVGMVFTVLPMYCGEIGEDSVRGALGSLMQLFIVFGLLFDYCIGPYVPYMWLSIGAAILPAVFVLLFFWMPESPYYLLGKNDIDGGKKSLKWLRGKSSEGIAQELKTIQADVENAQSQSGTVRDLFATKGTTKALILSLGLVGFQQFSGINVVLFNAQNIFKEAGGSLTAEVSTIITGVVMMVASMVTPFIVDRLGRRMLFLISGVGMAIAQAVLGLCFYLKERAHEDTSSYSFVPIIAVIGYIIVYCLGFGPLPWAVMGEMFPANIKSLASTLTASFCWILGFIITYFFNDLKDAIGNDFTFWIFGIFCVISVPFVFILLPETKGKSLQEIQEILNR